MRCFVTVLAVAAALVLVGCGEEGSSSSAKKAVTSHAGHDHADHDHSHDAPATTTDAADALKSAATGAAQAVADAAAKPMVINTVCPVGGEKIDPKDPKLLTFTYANKTIGFCCADCLEPFKKAPEKYMAALK